MHEVERLGNFYCALVLHNYILVVVLRLSGSMHCISMKYNVSVWKIQMLNFLVECKLIEAEMTKHFLTSQKNYINHHLWIYGKCYWNILEFLTLIMIQLQPNGCKIQIPFFPCSNRVRISESTESAYNIKYFKIKCFIQWFSSNKQQWMIARTIWAASNRRNSFQQIS